MFCVIYTRVLPVHLIQECAGQKVGLISWVVCERCGAYASHSHLSTDLVVSGTHAEPKQPVACRAVQISNSFPETGLTPGGQGER